MKIEEDLYSKKNLEPYYSQLFIDFINRKYGFTWRYHGPTKQSDSVDAFIITNTGTIQLQLVLAEGGQFKARAQNKIFEYCANEDWKRWITKAINHKKEKYYPDEKEIILLIQGYSPAPKKVEVEKYFKDKLVISGFKGIYYVVPEQTIYPNGYIAIIKNIFNFNL